MKDYEKKVRADKRKITLIHVVLMIALFLSMGLSLRMGTVKISGKDILKIIMGKLVDDKYLLNVKKSHVDIIYLIRGPRIFLAAIVGMGLSLSGLVMQGIVRNPIADPYILGISSGASLGATIAISLGLGRSLGGNYIGVFAFIGAFFTSILIIYMANRKKSDVSTLLLLGLAVNSLASALSTLIIYFSREEDGIRNISYWLMGSFSAGTWKNNFFLGISVLGTILFFLVQSRNLNLMLLGDEVSLSLGTDLPRLRLLYLTVLSFSLGLIVSASGVIGFIGLIIPHVTRIIFGSNHKETLLINVLIGGIFTVLMDILSRNLIRGLEIPIGVLISIIGSPIFIYLIFNRGRNRGGSNGN